jgi:hypothetical protein
VIREFNGIRLITTPKVIALLYIYIFWLYGFQRKT